MLDEMTFAIMPDAALEALKKSLITAEESADIEVEDQSGRCNCPSKMALGL